MRAPVLLPILFLILCPQLFAAEDALAIARHEESAERAKALNSKLERLEETMLSQQKTINGLRDEIRRLEEQLRAVSNSSKQTVNQESIRTLANAVREVDQKRISDNRNVLNRVNEAVTEIQKILRDRSTPPSVVKATPSPNADPMPARTNAAPRRAAQSSFTVVRQGESLPLLISRLN
ncbi:MAG TPA: hypothetical protein VMZ27_16375, partial [Candidatus Saccharimonadales bacterium]|nr:hypothetical protein [Candidatus Saccharimonadales bacterium]